MYFSIRKIAVLAAAIAAVATAIPANAEVTVGQNAKYVAVNASETDCRIEGRMWEFIDAAHSLADIIISFQKKFEGTAWDDLSEANEDEIREAILKATREFYETKIAKAKKAKPIFNDPQYPAAEIIDGDFELNFEHARPSAMYLVVTLLSGGGTEKARKAVKEVEETTKDLARGGLLKYFDPKGGGSIQFGLVFTPMCTWNLAKDPLAKVPPEDNRSEILHGDHYQKAWSAKIPGEYRRGWLKNGLPQFGNYNRDWVLIGNGSAGLGKEITSFDNSRIGKIINYFKPTIGFVWGDVPYSREITGTYAAANLNYGFKFPIGKKADGTKKFLTVGANNQWGCINSNSKKTESLIPYCDYLFRSWRFQPPPDARLAKDGFDASISLSKKAYFGQFISGETALRGALTLWGSTLEDQEDTLREWGYQPEDIEKKDPPSEPAPAPAPVATEPAPCPPPAATEPAPCPTAPATPPADGTSSQAAPVRIPGFKPIPRGSLPAQQ